MKIAKPNINYGRKPWATKISRNRKVFTKFENFFIVLVKVFALSQLLILGMSQILKLTFRIFLSTFLDHTVNNNFHYDALPKSVTPYQLKKESLKKSTQELC